MIVGVSGYLFMKKKNTAKKEVYIFTEVTPKLADISSQVSSLGIVQPQNRIEVKPTISGRIEKIMVVEGQTVYAGQILAYMSSTERASLLDAAKAKGSKTVSYWEDIYKPIPLIAPISGVVIVRSFEPGQMVSLADAVIVISDKLIIKAQVDETDIGKVKEGQKAKVILDAYADQTIVGRITHISYESKTYNNVTVYEVSVILQKIPTFVRSGMSANVNIITKTKKNILTLPLNAVDEIRGKKFVLLKKDKEQGKSFVKTGIQDEEKIEIIKGISDKDVVLIKEKKYELSNKKTSNSPFVVQRPGRNTKKK